MRLKLLPSSLLFLALLATSLVLPSCGTTRTVITEKGLHAVKLGGEMPAAGARRYKGYAMRDSLAEEAEFTWRVARLKASGGPIYVESDFFDREQVGRIRIESPNFRLRNGLAVGKQVEDLRAATQEWAIVPLKAYGFFDFYSRLFPNVHFLVIDPSHPMEEEDWEKYHAADFSSSAKIAVIVVY
jgi:hypothetical protein